MLDCHGSEAPGAMLALGHGSRLKGFGVLHKLFQVENVKPIPTRAFPGEGIPPEKFGEVAGPVATEGGRVGKA